MKEILWRQRRKELPYGVFKCPDGREVLFNRYYEPLLERSPDGAVRRADPGENFDGVPAEWFYDDKNPPTRNKRTREKCIAVLEEWGDNSYSESKLHNSQNKRVITLQVEEIE